MSGPILLFGARGQIARELAALANARGLPLVGLTHAEADITNEVTVRAALDVHRPAVAVNCAGYTAVARAEREVDAATAGNVTGPAVLAAACAAVNVPLVHISTDYVFDGAKKGAYVETDKVNPLGVYGRTKAEGEARVREAKRHIILRTSWVYGVYGRNFLKTVLKLAAERDELKMVADQFGCPTATADIAEAILTVVRTLGESSVSGTFHFAGQGVTSWHGFASEIVRRQAVFTGRSPNVIEIKSAEYPSAVRRPMNSELDSSRFRAVFGYVASPWQFRVAEVVAALLAPAAIRKAAP
jgi:dTDP-4-dehydrorhamnose reductase